jgi:hypothetical protein
LRSNRVALSMGGSLQIRLGVYGFLPYPLASVSMGNKTGNSAKPKDLSISDQ